MILILSIPDDPPTLHALSWFAKRGVAARVFYSDRLPAIERLTLSWEPNGRHRRAGTMDGEPLDFDRVGAVWHRRALVGSPTPQAVPDPRLRRFAHEETVSALKQLWKDWDVPFLPAPWSVLQDQQSKLRQLNLAARLGFEIPSTLVTNDPNELVAFYKAHDGRCIVKHITHVSLEESGLLREFSSFTEPVSPRDIAAAESTRQCLTLMQGYVPKRVELRVTVVGEHVFAAEIHSQSAEHSQHDYRRYDFSHARTRKHSLPSEVSDRCAAIVKAMGCRYGALDLILTPDGRYVFLENNPGGEFHWIEAQTGMPITAAICELLYDLDKQTMTRGRIS